MTKQQLVEAILQDMYKKSDCSQRTIDLTWKAYLKRQHKFYLEKILKDRTGR